MTADGLRLHVRERVGSVYAPTVVLLHGLAVSHRYLMPTARRLGPGTVYLPDLPGFGLSATPPTVLDVTAHAHAVCSLLDVLETGSVALLGNSFGCQIAVEMALHRPDLVTALILTGPTTDPSAASPGAQIARLLLTLPHEDPRQMTILAADIRNAGPRRIYRTLRHAVQDRITPKLSAVRVPTLLLRGSHDKIAPQDWLDHAASLLPQAVTATISGAGHNVGTTAGAHTAAAVKQFLGTT